nr:hypothetical protein Iba_chr13bCG14380 [Ipomoea batatas]
MMQSRSWLSQATLATGCRCSSSSTRRREGSGGVAVRTGGGRGTAMVKLGSRRHNCSFSDHRLARPSPAFKASPIIPPSPSPPSSDAVRFVDRVWQMVLLPIGGSGGTSFRLPFGEAALVMEEWRRSGDGGGLRCFPPSAPAGTSTADLSPLSVRQLLGFCFFGALSKKVMMVLVKAGSGPFWPDLDSYLKKKKVGLF